MGVQKHYKKRFANNLVEQLLQDNRQKVRTQFFLMIGAKNTQNAKHNKNIAFLLPTDPGPFLACDPPSHCGGHRFGFEGGPLNPCALFRPHPAGGMPGGADETQPSQTGAGWGVGDW
jgi:hypothetical protein